MTQNFSEPEPESNNNSMFQQSTHTEFFQNGNQLITNPDTSDKINSYLEGNLPCFQRQKLTKQEAHTWNSIKESFAKYKVSSMYYQTLVCLIGQKTAKYLEKLIEKEYIKQITSAKGDTILSIPSYK